MLLLGAMVLVVAPGCSRGDRTSTAVDGVALLKAQTELQLVRQDGDPTHYARAVFTIIERALTEGGFTLSDVVRTRMFVTDMAFADELSPIHGEVFRDVRPAATMVAVAGLMHPSLLVEIEVDAHRAPKD